jgi:hypothetical protein
MTSDVQEQNSDSLITMSLQQLLRITLLGVLVGAVTWGLMVLFEAYVFKSTLCSGNASTPCTSALEYASAIATVLGAGLGLVVLVRLQVFRSLLIVLAASISLWGVEITLSTWTWPYALLVSILLFAIAYSLFAWIARLRSFLTALIVIVVLIVAIRLALNA